MADQPRRSLSRAHQARRQQGELGRQLRAGEVDPVELVKGNVPEWEPVIRTMRLGRLLPRFPEIGEVTTEEILDEAELRPRHTLEGLTYEKRAELAHALAIALGRDLTTGDTSV